MKVLIEIHTYPSNGNDAERAHKSLVFDEFNSDVECLAAGEATRRELQQMLKRDALRAPYLP